MAHLVFDSKMFGYLFIFVMFTKNYLIVAQTHQEFIGNFTEIDAKGIVVIEWVKSPSEGICYCKSYLVMIDSSIMNYICYDTLIFPYYLYYPKLAPSAFFEAVRKYHYQSMPSLVENRLMVYQYVDSLNQAYLISSEAYELNQNKILTCYNFSGKVALLHNVYSYLEHSISQYDRNILFSYRLDKSCFKNSKLFGGFVLYLLRLEEISPLTHKQVANHQLKKTTQTIFRYENTE